MRKDDLHNIITKHWNKIKIFWGIFAIAVMLLAIKTYVNYSVITQEIEKVNTDINNTRQEIAYSENFYSKYLDSEYSLYFLSHKNNVLFDWEYIIKVSTTPKQSQQEITQTPQTEINETPQQSRNRFIKSKIK